MLDIESSQVEAFQRAYLRSLAHSKKPVVQVGQAGATEAVLKAVDVALTDHELVKVRMTRPENKKALSLELSERSGSVLCGLVGHTVILYRRHPKAPKINLPSAS